MTRLKDKVTVTAILLVTSQGKVVTLDFNKVQIIDKQSKQPLFKEAKNG